MFTNLKKMFTIQKNFANSKNIHEFDKIVHDSKKCSPIQKNVHQFEKNVRNSRKCSLIEKRSRI